MKKANRGYFNFDFTGFFVAAVLVGVLIGLLLTLAIPWAWQYIKPLIHSWTA